MQLKPNNNWRWYFDDEHNRMMLDFADGMLFRSRFSRKSLISDAFNDELFTVEDASFYGYFSKKCQQLDLTAEQQAELSLNALVAWRFLKPQMPKSWYFVTQCSGWQPQCADIAYAWLTSEHYPLPLLVAEAGDNASLCLIAQPELALAGRVMQLGEAIKIMNDRLVPGKSWQQKQFDQAV